MALSTVCVLFVRRPALLCRKLHLTCGNTPHRNLIRQLHGCTKILQMENAFPEGSSSEHSEEENEHSYDTEQVKLDILEASLNYVLEHGWSRSSLAAGAKSVGLSSAAHGMFPDGGAELVHYFNSSNNRELERLLKEKSTQEERRKDLQTYLEDALEFRLRMTVPYISRWPEAMALAVLPQNVGSDTRNVMDLVDTIWYYSGDKSVNMRWYSKRVALAAAYKACELSLVQDKSPDYMDTWEFLERRVQTVTGVEDCAQQFQDTYSQMSEVCDGAIITIQNILGLNRWRRGS